MENRNLTTHIKTPNATIDVAHLATMFHNGCSLSRMAKEFLNDEKAKGEMHRILRKAIRENYALFKN